MRNAVGGSRQAPQSGSEDPSHRNSVLAPAASRAQLLWERPWPRQGLCMPQASIPAAVGVGRPLLQNPRPGSGRESGAPPCGSGLGRDRARACRKLRSRPLSGSEDPSYRTPVQAPASNRAPLLVRAALAATGPLHTAGFGSGRCRGQKTPPTETRSWLRPRIGRPSLWERPWPRQSPCMPQASIQAAVGVRRPLLQNTRPGSGRESGAPLCGSGLGRDRAYACHKLRSRPLSGSEDSACKRPRRPMMAKKNRGIWPRFSLLLRPLTPSPASPGRRRRSTAGSACRPSSDARRST